MDFRKKGILIIKNELEACVIITNLHIIFAIKV